MQRDNQYVPIAHNAPRNGSAAMAQLLQLFLLLLHGERILYFHERFDAVLQSAVPVVVPAPPVNDVVLSRHKRKIAPPPPP